MNELEIIKEVIGLKFSKGGRITYDSNHQDLFFLESSKFKVQIYVVEDCCNGSWIEDIEGDVHDIIDEPITMFELVSNREEENDYYKTWTFIKIGTKKGSITIRFVGESNGYYTEHASVFILDKNNPESEWEKLSIY